LISLRFGRRAAWGIADQTFSSITNFAVGIFVASQTSVAAFGAFALAFATYLLVLNLGRAVVSQPLLIRHSHQSVADWERTASRGTGAALAIGAGFGALSAAAGLVAGGHLGGALLALGLCLPGLLLQDAWRFAFFAAGRDRDAFLNDVVWAAVLIPIFAALLALGSKSIFEAVIGWGGAATMAGLVGMTQARVTPRIRGLQTWFNEHADLIPRFVAETLARLGTVQVMYYLIGLISGIVAVGTIRAGELILIGPFNVLFQGVNLIALPEATRQLQHSRLALLRWSRLLSAGMGACALIWGVICLGLPDPIGRTVLGASWEPARTVLVPIIVSLTGLVISSGAMVGLRALGAADRILRVAVLTSAVTLAITSLGAWLGGASGAAWAMAAGSWFGAACTWVAFQVAEKRRA
jgi:O-antigen/teichoic acid export membrane protein